MGLLDDDKEYIEGIIEDLHLDDDRVQEIALAEIENLLKINGRSLADFPPMPMPNEAVMRNIGNLLISEELNYDRNALRTEHAHLLSSLTGEQRSIYDKIMSAVNGGRPVASSGIASQLIPGGRTAHSRFAIPLNIDWNSTCHIVQGSDLTELMVHTKLIIWDEAPMAHRHCFEALDRTLRDIMHSQNAALAKHSFGGKVVVLGSEFRQILPVIPRAGREDIVLASLNSSYLWPSCKVLSLTKNMRLSQGYSVEENSSISRFAEWILKVGEGNIGKIMNDEEHEITIDDDILIDDAEDPIQAIVESTYPKLVDNFKNYVYFRERAILPPTLDDVAQVNEFMLGLLPGEERTYLSSDAICNQDPQDQLVEVYTTEFLNTTPYAVQVYHIISLNLRKPSTKNVEGAEDAKVAVMCWWSAEVANRYSVIGGSAQCSRAAHSVIEWCTMSRGAYCDWTCWAMVVAGAFRDSSEAAIARAWFVSHTTVVGSRPPSFAAVRSCPPSSTVLLRLLRLRFVRSVPFRSDICALASLVVRAAPLRRPPLCRVVRRSAASSAASPAILQRRPPLRRVVRHSVALSAAPSPSSLCFYMSASWLYIYIYGLLTEFATFHRPGSCVVRVASLALEDLSASAASSSSDEDLDVTEPWLVRRHIPESCFGDLSWLDDSIASHKSTLCRMGHIRALRESYFSPYESFLRATSNDASLSLAVGVRGGKHFHFQARPLGSDRFITGLRDSLRSWREEFFFVFPGGGERLPWWFVADGVSRFPCGWVVPHEARPRPKLNEMSRASVETLNALEGKSYCYDDLVAFGLFLDVLPAFELLTDRVLLNRALLCARRLLVLPLPGDVLGMPFFVREVLLPSDSSDPAEKHKVCPADDTPGEKAAKRGRADQSGVDSGKEKRTFSVHPRFADLVGGFLPPSSLDESRLADLADARSRGLVPPYPNVGPIPRAATEDSLFNNQYDAAAVVRGKFSCPPDREAMENFVYTHGLRALRDVITRDLLRTLYCQSFYCEFSNSFDEYESAREVRNLRTVQHAREVMASLRTGISLHNPPRLAPFNTKVDCLEKRVVELAAEKEEEIDKGQDGARWGWDNFRTQLEHLNPGLDYHASSMRIDWEVVDGVSAPIPSDEGDVGAAGASDAFDDPAGGRGGGSAGPVVSLGSDCAPNTVLHGDPSVVIAPSPRGPSPAIYPDGVPTSPSSDEVSAAATIAGDLVRETGCGTPDASPWAIPAICELDGSFDGAYLFSAPP
ncbi:ATP-dependent DNA helicase PIF1-like [Senna tora]|uniref:ATP-dependent DNA helicase n=1 Tax=Senna tora TaxID=362788 RepID=A0A834X0B8_9FABA|nr:ATP-dependent DNA helicase PIF1-like [Senna tora]